MKNAVFTRFMALLMFFSALAVSCAKDDDDGDGAKPENGQLPVNKQDAEAKIKGKWDISTTDEVRSVEFLDGDSYILEVAGSLFPSEVEASLSARSVPPLSKEASLGAAAASREDSQQLLGKFTVGADGKTISLDDIAHITIASISEREFTFEIIFTDGQSYSISANLAGVVDSTKNTDLLARTWGFPLWEEFDLPNAAIFERHGFKPQDQGLTFTKSGTMLMRYLNYEESTSVDPKTGVSSTVIKNITLETDIYFWKWKNDAQTSVTATRNGDSFDVSINSLTETRLNATLPNNKFSWSLKAL